LTRLRFGAITKRACTRADALFCSLSKDFDPSVLG
jgi:hypothetical protein